MTTLEYKSASRSNGGAKVQVPTGDHTNRQHFKGTSSAGMGCDVDEKSFGKNRPHPALNLALLKGLADQT